MAGLVAVGRDTYCLDSLVPGRTVVGAMLVGQRCYRRLITQRGKLRGGEEEADFGLDLAGFIGCTDDRQLDSMLPVVVQNELRKDPAVESVRVVALRSAAGGEVSWTLTISITTTAGEVVEIVLSASDVTVELVGLR